MLISSVFEAHLVLMVNFNFRKIIKEALTGHLHKTAVKLTRVQVSLIFVTTER